MEKGKIDLKQVLDEISVMTYDEIATAILNNKSSYIKDLVQLKTEADNLFRQERKSESDSDIKSLIDAWISLRDELKRTLRHQDRKNY
ncbi:hypothetical protein [Fundicoccus culcitae]|uniref:Uncharacterized protein n=1 Tax=Fundicoccus culcitae TaxID=2969821 RepID=A0ABY5P5X8_9LACT|nr:hypothetical protein [Fundicoccus culcitae]UUX33890.1 hypothetical protein NRE15_13555 [Fundicoccus culcitae]